MSLGFGHRGRKITLCSAAGRIGEVWVDPAYPGAAVKTLRSTAAEHFHRLRRYISLCWNASLLSVEGIPALLECPEERRVVLALVTHCAADKELPREAWVQWGGPPPLVSSSEAERAPAATQHQR